MMDVVGELHLTELIKLKTDERKEKGSKRKEYSCR